MKRSLIPAVLAALILMTAGLAAQDESPFKVTKLTDKIHQLTTDQGAYTTNALVFVGEDGLLLVDTDSEENADEFKKVIDSFGKGSPRYIINTHRHVEHVGGNAIFGGEPTIISHYLVPERLRGGSYLFNEFPDETMPDITFTDSLTLMFNGEKIRLVTVAGSHDDNEIMVHFTGQKVVHLSSLVNGLNFPSVDRDGDVLQFAPVIARAIELLPEDVTIVSGHNNNCTWQDLHAYHDMIVKTTALVREGLAEGKDVAALQEEKIIEPWTAYAGSYVSPEEWIQQLADGLDDEKEHKKYVFEPLYYALRDEGVEAAKALYLDLKKQDTGEYEFREADLLIIGDKLLTKDRIPEAIAMLELSLEEYPEGTYPYYCHYELGLCYKEQGEKDKAVDHCEKSLALNPDFQAAATLLEELKQ